MMVHAIAGGAERLTGFAPSPPVSEARDVEPKPVILWV
jgi:hypothetical protein